MRSKKISNKYMPSESNQTELKVSEIKMTNNTINAHQNEQQEVF